MCRYEFAIKNYNETITYVRHGLRMGETDSEGIPFAAKATGLDPEAKAVIAVCYSNMAACSLKLSRFEEAIKHATTALGQDLKGTVPLGSSHLTSTHFKNLSILFKDKMGKRLID